MVRVGRTALPDNDTFSVVIEWAKAARWEKVIYGVAIGDKVQRIGSPKGKSGERCKEWTRDVTTSLRVKHKRTPKLEAEGCRKCLRQHDRRGLRAHRLPRHDAGSNLSSV